MNLLCSCLICLHNFLAYILKHFVFQIINHLFQFDYKFQIFYNNLSITYLSHFFCNNLKTAFGFFHQGQNFFDLYIDINDEDVPCWQESFVLQGCQNKQEAIHLVTQLYENKFL